VEPEAAKKVRGDSFVAETNIHWPTESSLIRDGLRKMLAFGLTLAAAIGQRGWRQHAHWLTKANRLARDIDRIAAKKGPNYEQRLKPKYRELLKLSGNLTQRTRKLVAAAESHGGGDAATIEELRTFLQLTEQVRDTARRRVLLGDGGIPGSAPTPLGHRVGDRRVASRQRSEALPRPHRTGVPALHLAGHPGPQSTRAGQTADREGTGEPRSGPFAPPRVRGLSRRSGSGSTSPPTQPSLS